MVAARSERPELERLPDVGRHVGHEERAETAPLPIGRRADGLDVAGPQRTTIDVKAALDDGTVRDDLAIELEHEMDAAERMVPVVVAEPLVLVRPEPLNEQRADGRDLLRP